MQNFDPNRYESQPVHGQPLKFSELENGLTASSLDHSLNGDSKMGVTITRMKEFDVTNVMEMAAKVKELAFQDWENTNLLKKLVDSESSILLVARVDDKIAGFLIGGSFGVRGTVTHLYVDEPYKRHGVGRELFRQSIECFREIGVRRLHVMITSGNDQAVRFWKSMDFEIPAGEHFMEKDI